MKAIGYTRCSTDLQASEGVSLQNQVERITGYCQYKGFELVDIIEDAGISGGKNRARAGFIELLDRIETGDVQAIILYSLERVSRDMLTLLSLERLLDERDVELHTVEGQINTSTPDGWLNFAMKAFLGEMERRQVKYRTKRAMEYKKGQGAVVGSIPYGYRREGNGLVVDLQEQSIVRLVNTLYSQSMRLVDICKELKARDIRTRNGKDFTPQQIKRIIAGYEQTFQKSNTKLGVQIRTFIEAIA
jgi:site-specific DNA recombinase